MQQSYYMGVICSQIPSSFHGKAQYRQSANLMQTQLCIQNRSTQQRRQRQISVQRYRLKHYTQSALKSNASFPKFNESCQYLISESNHNQVKSKSNQFTQGCRQNQNRYSCESIAKKSFENLDLQQNQKKQNFRYKPAEKKRNLMAYSSTVREVHGSPYQVQYSLTKRPKESKLNGHYYSSMTYQNSTKIPQNKITNPYKISPHTKIQIFTDKTSRQSYSHAAHIQKDLYPNPTQIKTHDVNPKEKLVPQPFLFKEITHQLIYPIGSAAQRLNQLLQRNLEYPIEFPTKYLLGQQIGTKNQAIISHQLQRFDGKIEELDFDEMARNICSADQNLVKSIPNQEYRFDKHLYGKQQSLKKTQSAQRHHSCYSNEQSVKVLQKCIQPKIIKIMEDQEYRNKLTERLIQRANQLHKKKPIHTRYSNQSRSESCRKNIHKKSLIIQTFRQKQTKTEVEQEIENDLNIIVNTRSIKSIKRMDQEYLNIIETGVTGQSINKLLRQKLSKRYGSGVPKTLKQKIVRKEASTFPVEQMGPNPW